MSNQAWYTEALKKERKSSDRGSRWISLAGLMPKTTIVNVANILSQTERLRVMLLVKPLPLENT